MTGASITAVGAALALAATELPKLWTGAPSVAQDPAQSAPLSAQAPAAAPQPAVAPLTDDQVKLVVKTLEAAPAEGFRPNEFRTEEAQRLLASNDPAERDRGQALIRRAAIAYARAQHGGRVAKDRPDDWGIEPAPYDAEADFNFALSQNKLAEWLAAQPPPFERYRALKAGLARYRELAAHGGWNPIPEGPALKPGAHGPRVAALRNRLAAESGDTAIANGSPVYDPALVAAVKTAQARFGQEPDGVVDAGTLKALNTPVETRIAQIEANMERWRWMPRAAWPTTRIEVNIPGQHLDVYDNNNLVDSMKVVVGAPDKKTPMLISQIHSIVFNPPWNVPKSIAAKEILPKGPGYLQRKGFVWVKTGNGGARLQQKPGPGNSLGRIKFDFNNSYGVYLHDTNAKTAFGRDARSISHGCVRVERPEELADMLLGSDTRWSDGRMQEVLADTTTVRASLPFKVPVMLLYWTAFPGEGGQLSFRDDIYGWDDVLSERINSGGIAT